MSCPPNGLHNNIAFVLLLSCQHNIPLLSHRYNSNNRNNGNIFPLLYITTAHCIHIHTHTHTHISIHIHTHVDGQLQRKIVILF